MCHTSWGGDVFLDRRMQFGDKSAVEGLFQFTANLILVSAQDAIDGDPATRALVPHAAHLRQYIDAKPTHAAYRLWERERVAVFGEDVTQLRANHTDGYVGDFMGSALGRRRAFATAAVHRAFIGKRGANFPLKALKVCLPAPSLGGLIDLDSKTATLSAERAEKYSAQTREVLNSPRYDDTEFHRYTSRLVSAARYEPAGRAWLVSSYCALKQARRRSEKRGGRTRVFIGPGAKKEAQFPAPRPLTRAHAERYHRAVRHWRRRAWTEAATPEEKASRLEAGVRRRGRRRPRRLRRWWSHIGRGNGRHRIRRKRPTTRSVPQRRRCARALRRRLRASG